MTVLGLRTTPLLLTCALALPACDPAPGDSETDTEAVTATIGATSVVSTTGGESGGESGAPTGTGDDICMPLPQYGDPCTDDSDCAIAGDCCSCIAYNPMMGSPGNCGGGCGQTVCEQLGLTDAYCDAGACRVRGLSCDQTAVTCLAAPPMCNDGELPQVIDGCFTADCLPVEYCDWVPDCSACPADEHCVVTQTPACDQTSCIPDFPECPPGPPSCDCLGDVACSPPYDNCAMNGDVIVCS